MRFPKIGECPFFGGVTPRVTMYAAALEACSPSGRGALRARDFERVRRAWARHVAYFDVHVARVVAAEAIVGPLGHDLLVRSAELRALVCGRAALDAVGIASNVDEQVVVRAGFSHELHACAHRD